MARIYKINIQYKMINLSFDQLFCRKTTSGHILVTSGCDKTTNDVFKSRNQYICIYNLRAFLNIVSSWFISWHRTTSFDIVWHCMTSHDIIWISIKRFLGKFWIYLLVLIPWSESRMGLHHLASIVDDSPANQSLKVVVDKYNVGDETSSLWKRCLL